MKTSLETVEITVTITSPATRAILKTCRGLVNFKVTSPFNLCDASGNIPWVCKGLQQLCLEIRAGLPMSTYSPSSSSFGVYKPYYLRLPTKSPSSKEAMVLEQLENFYGQISNLAHLRRLELYFHRTRDVDDYSDSDDNEAEEEEEEVDWSSSENYSDDQYKMDYRHDYKKPTRSIKHSPRC